MPVEYYFIVFFVKYLRVVFVFIFIRYIRCHVNGEKYFFVFVIIPDYFELWNLKKNHEIRKWHGTSLRACVCDCRDS